MQFENTISYTASWPNNPNLRAEYKQLCHKLASQLQNAKQSQHWQAVIQCVYKLAGTIASYTLNHAWARQCTYTCTAVHLLASYSKLCSIFKQHAGPSTSHL